MPTASGVSMSSGGRRTQMLLLCYSRTNALISLPNPNHSIPFVQGCPASTPAPPPSSITGTGLLVVLPSVSSLSQWVTQLVEGERQREIEGD